MASAAAIDWASAEGLDLSHFWMPFTNNRFFKANPRLFVSAKDMHFTTADGRQVLDATSGLWCVNAGHGREAITEAIREAAGVLDFGPTFQLGHPLPFRLASELAAMMPAGLDRVFFTNSGSESADTALKMALAYHHAKGDSTRFRLIGRQRGYHGTNFGGMSVGGIGGNRRRYVSQVWGVDHLAHTHGDAVRFQRGLQPGNGGLAEELEELVALHGPETIAAVIVEPVAGSTGVLVPPQGYLQALRDITRKHGILLIFDEVITGFGRVGDAATAAEVFGVTPDIVTLAKGLTNATVPMGAVVASREVHDTIVNGSPAGIEFFHGYTYSGHPLASAAGLAALALYRQEGLFARTTALAPVWEEAMHGLRDCPNVIDIRNVGLVAGIELAPRDGAIGARAMEAFHRAFDAGLLIRVTGDIIALSPPLIVSEAQIGEIADKLRTVLHETA
ncbi:aminotransferase class III-fold pyridoxal phosphate-dependent enzyme [Novosphingobium cyanobacteriorum]|uniref:Aminotransferase class III-fold pyridoxal phosphate-dependent enzyme n=1 Tax=Novosphingobium cyanobacteriorum TaxID=3024215 RepID=A0ABT6CMD6_9SPHN|nr:aminotransferase class III-fold pyridoxal phosphate-dependent enzyme [Novosphingobium cyanobacteriorum]MDF8334733.1 aminotransferase class III-fold pyridoxal phosphate-dependent enzyme [Novosphingobium cyanobacteriorum]